MNATGEVSRTNEDWLGDLRASGERRNEALLDLRRIVLAGLPYALSRWLSPGDPAFDPLIEEVAQETLLRVLDRLDSFEGRSKFTTWVHKIAIRLALTELRRARWKDLSLEQFTDPDAGGLRLDLLQDPEPDPAMSAEQHDLLRRVGRILQEDLTERQRQALIAVGVHGLPTEEVARRMGSNRNALYKLLHDARMALKHRLEEEGLSSEDVLSAFER